MSDWIKNSLAIIGSLIIILFISVCIGMTTTSFRNKVYDILDVVSEKQATEQVMGYLDEISELNNEKQFLINQIAMLDKTNEVQAKTIKSCEEKINDLNKQIIELTSKLSNVSKNINNATVTYICTYNNTFYAIFDDSGNYAYHTGTIENKNTVNHISGEGLLNFVNENERIVKEIIPKSANSSLETSMYMYDYYEITIQNQTIGMDILHDETYIFTTDTILNMQIICNGTEVSISDLSSVIDTFATYDCAVKFNYSVNADNQITDFTCKITITSN